MYWEETIPADANPGPLVHTALATKLLAAGYTLEDTVVISTRTHKVYKSAAAGNTYGLDWYLDVSYPTTGITGGVYITPFEGYNSTTHLATRGPYSGSSGATTMDPTTYSRYGATASALETNWANTATHSSLDNPLSISEFALMASVNRNRVILAVSTDPQFVSYAGFFTPTAGHVAHAGAAMYPLITTRVTGSGGSSATNNPISVTAALTRAPKVSTVNWEAHVAVAPSNMGRVSGLVGGAAGEGDNLITCTTYMVGLDAATFTKGSTVIGDLDGLKVAWADIGVTRADTVTVEGVVYATTTVTGSGGVTLIEKV